MKLGNHLVRNGLVVPLEGDTEEARILVLLHRMAPSAEAERLERLASTIAEGRAGERLDGASYRIWASQTDLMDKVRLSIGVAERGDVDAASGEDAVPPIHILILTPRRLTALRDQVLPTLQRFLKEEGNVRRILAARSAAELEAFGAMHDVWLYEHLLVEDALVSVQYRVYPDTPFVEVADLMVRRDLHAVPVVGEDYEFLGIVSTGDALRNLLPRTRVTDPRTKGADKPLVARDVMTRSVMCVSEDQSLFDAANTMMNRDVEQLPVVREGQLVGVIDRSSVLDLVFGQAAIPIPQTTTD